MGITVRHTASSGRRSLSRPGPAFQEGWQKSISNPGSYSIVVNAPVDPRDKEKDHPVLNPSRLDPKGIQTVVTGRKAPEQKPASF